MMNRRRYKESEEGITIACYILDCLSIETNVPAAASLSKITLSAYSPSSSTSDSSGIVTVTLKDTAEGGMATALKSVSFGDNEMTPFPSGPSAITMAGELPASHKSATALSIKHIFK